MTIRIDSIAADEIGEAAKFYEDRREGLGGEFLDEIGNTLQRIEENPRSYVVLRGETRRANLNRFPYALLYRIHQDVIIVLGCLHGKRDPRIWLRRAE